MSGSHILAIDQGTTGTTVLVVDPQLRVKGRATVEYKQIYPKPGWVEHDPEDIWLSVTKAITQALKGASLRPQELGAIGITNQRETTVLWHKATGRPCMNAMVWQDRRTAEDCHKLKEQGHESLFREKTGLVLDPYFSGTKLAWMLREVNGARTDAEAGKALFGTIDSYLVWRLTGGAEGGVHVTDVSNASRTLMFGLQGLKWEPELLKVLGIPEACLPRVVSSAEVYGKTRGLSGILPDGIPLCGMAGDQQAALFGQACFEPGDAKITFGTGAFMLMNTGKEIVHSKNNLITTVAWQVAGQVNYALEGSAFIAGAAVQWLRDGLKLIHTAGQVEALAETVENSGSVVFVPALTGLGAPHWRPDARGALMGLTRDSNAGHIARACLEGIALQNAEILLAMDKDATLVAHLKSTKVDGGAAANNLLMQLQADVLRIPCVRPKVIETTAVGAACLAGLGAGMFTDLAAVKNAWKEDRVFQPRMKDPEREALMKKWARAVAVA
ncbi:MAG: glycerol kinase GlpK [Deltaproteobacteria bacterium]|nr:glycerol kinase GlpK [Deltaproteobacteria bacterium]